MTFRAIQPNPSHDLLLMSSQRSFMKKKEKKLLKLFRDCSPPPLKVDADIWKAPLPGGTVFKPKRVDSILYTMIEFFNHGIQGTATWSQLSLVPQLQTC